MVVGCGGPPVAFGATRTGSASVRGPWRVLGAARRGHVLGAACGVGDAGGGVTPARAAPGRGAATRIDSADAPPSGIAAAGRNDPVTARGRTLGDTTRSADATPARAVVVRRNGPVGALRHVISDTASRNRSSDATPARAAAVGRNGPVGVLRRRGRCRGARWG
ncbi:hypothetical protein ABZ235_37045 [Streptomyces canus]|uniref:hypothetical protein n=1 Tax=Streptomyces canus TaxID=58343 RepID=UPI0033A69CA1